jgi:hypothetical protein
MSQLERFKAAAPVAALSPWLLNEAQSSSLTIAQPALSRPVRKASHGKAPNQASTIGAVLFHFFLGVGTAPLSQNPSMYGQRRECCFS